VLVEAKAIVCGCCVGVTVNRDDGKFDHGPLAAGVVTGVVLVFQVPAPGLVATSALIAAIKVGLVNEPV
jgi:hypothetical protein